MTAVVSFSLLLAAGSPVRALEEHADRLRALEVRPDTLTRFVEEVVDLEQVCTRLLGPHRSALSAEQLREFSRLFVAILVARARQHAALLGDFQEQCSLESGSLVSCELRHGDASARAWFTLSRGRIVDARVGDVTMIRENREAIDRLMRSRGADGLLEKMRQRARAARTRRD